MITDDHVATLKAVLTEDLDKYESLVDSLEDINGGDGLNVLIAAAFYEAVYRFFGNGYSIPDVIRFVADERARLEDPEADFDARSAERLILAALGTGSVGGIDERMKGQAQVSLLVAMVARADLDDTGLDELLREARMVATNTRPSS